MNDVPNALTTMTIIRAVATRGSARYAIPNELRKTRSLFCSRFDALRLEFRTDDSSLKGPAPLLRSLQTWLPAG